MRPGLEPEQQPGCLRDARLSRGYDAQRQNLQVSISLSFFFLTLSVLLRAKQAVLGSQTILLEQHIWNKINPKCTVTFLEQF